MNSHRPDPRRMSWAVSPAFRSGPRQTSHEYNAQEIIRFVREYQRADVKQAGASHVKRKNVLPAIKYYDNLNTSDKFNISDKPRGIISSELNSEVYCSSRPTLYNNDKQGYTKEYSDGDSNNNNYNDSMAAASVETAPEGIRNKNSKTAESKTCTKSLLRESMLPENKSSSSSSNQTTRRISDKLLLGTPVTSFMSSSGLNKTTAASHDVGKSRQLSRPRVLPQLTPRYDFFMRPSAPSPTHVSSVQSWR